MTYPFSRVDAKPGNIVHDWLSMAGDWLLDNFIFVKEELISRPSLEFYVDTQVATGADTTEITFFSHEFAKNELKEDGTVLHLKAFGAFANNANGSTVRVKFGSTTLATLTKSGASKLAWHVDCYIVCKFANLQRAVVNSIIDSDTPEIAIEGTLTEDNGAGAISLSITGQNGSASAGDVTLEVALLSIVKGRKVQA